MLVDAVELTMSYAERIEVLRAAKSAQTTEKQAVRGSMDYDDHGIVLPPAGVREVVHICTRMLSTFLQRCSAELWLIPARFSLASRPSKSGSLLAFHCSSAP